MSSLALFGGPKEVDEHSFDVSPSDEEIESIVHHLRELRKPLSQETPRTKLEEAIRRSLQVEHAIATNNGTAALQEAYFALDIGPGDEVIMSCYGYYAGLLTLMQQNGIPIFCEADPSNLSIDVEDVQHRITKNTKAILVTHMWGLPPKMDKLQAIVDGEGIAIIEDAARGLGGEYKGKKLGTLGDIGCFSLQTNKAIGTGEGGLFVTHSEDLYRRALSFAHELSLGLQGSSHFETALGVKHRIHPLAAVIALQQLQGLDERVEKSRRNFKKLHAALRPFPFVVLHEEAPHVTRGAWSGYVFRYAHEELGVSSDLFVRALQAEGVKIKKEYGSNLLHTTAAYQDPNAMSGRCMWQCPHNTSSPRFHLGDFRQTENLVGQLLIIEGICSYTRDNEDIINAYGRAFSKVYDNQRALRR